VLDDGALSSTDISLPENAGSGFCQPAQVLISAAPSQNSSASIAGDRGEFLHHRQEAYSNFVRWGYALAMQRNRLVSPEQSRNYPRRTVKELYWFKHGEVRQANRGVLAGHLARISQSSVYAKHAISETRVHAS
jgi:hypothetical protein